MDTLFGLPAHPFLVHIPIVLLPVAAIGVIAMVIKPAWHRRYRWIVLGTGVAGAIGATLAAQAARSSRDASSPSKDATQPSAGSTMRNSARRHATSGTELRSVGPGFRDGWHSEAFRASSTRAGPELGEARTRDGTRRLQELIRFIGHTSMLPDGCATVRPHHPAVDTILRRRMRDGTMDGMAAHYKAPGWFTRNVFNRSVAFLTRHGVSVMGSRVLAVRGRTSGEWRTTPVNLLGYEGKQYLVAPRGETQWVKNLRAVGVGELRVGKKTQVFSGREIPDDDKVAILRAYLKRWKVEVGVFFDGVGPDSTDDELRAIGPRHPVFAVEPAPRA
jgi:deazaflavin-dependent oxidoreductase (nitroreductase family)